MPTPDIRASAAQLERLLRDLAEAVNALVFESEEFEFDDGLGRGALLEHWDRVEDAVNRAIEVVAGIEPSGGGRAACDVLVERRRQVEIEGWTAEHDALHTDDSLARAAAWYALPEATRRTLEANDLSLWPQSWADGWFKPGARRRDLVKAAALLIAEIERLDSLCGGAK